LAVTQKNYLAHNNLAYHLFTQGKIAEAISEYEAALTIFSDYTDAHSNLGRALAAQEHYPEAMVHFEAVLRVHPNDVIAHNNLGNILALTGRHADAIEHFRAALTVKPDHAAAHNNWALSAEAVGRGTEAVEHYRAALQINPKFPAALNNLAWLLATCPDATLRNGAEAMQHAEHACTLTGYEQPLPLLTLAAASAEAGHLAEAISLCTRARELAGGDASLIERSDAMLKEFNAGHPYRVSPSTLSVPAEPR
jgi:Tfp pilus assembly protein PilF